MSDKPDVLFVAAASYDSVDAAVSDYEAIKALYYEVKTSDDFDAAVIAKGEEGKVEIVKKQSSRLVTAPPTASMGARRRCCRGAVPSDRDHRRADRRGRRGRGDRRRVRARQRRH